MFKQLPTELNLHILGFLSNGNLRQLKSIATVSKLANQTSQIAQKKIFEKFYNLSGNNFKLVKKEMLKSLFMNCLPQINVAYFSTEFDKSPYSLPCPLDFNYAKNSRKTLSQGRFSSEEWERYKKDFGSLMPIRPSQAESEIAEDTNCIVIFSLDQNLEDIKKTYDNILQARTRKNKAMPFIILINVGTPKTLEEKLVEFMDLIMKTLTKHPTFESELSKELGCVSIKTMLNKLKSDEHFLKRNNEYLTMINDLSKILTKRDIIADDQHTRINSDSLNFPIAAVIHAPINPSSPPLLWKKLTETFHIIEEISKAFLMTEYDQSKPGLMKTGSPTF